jgi:hypothetical protein
MAEFVYLVENNCADPKREKEFNDWYNNTHLPEALESEGFVKATRYELTNPVEGKGKYLAIYEIRSDDIESTLAKHNDRMAKKKAQECVPGSINTVLLTVSRGMYKKIVSIKK